MLTKEQLHLFESYDRMFMTDGWKELVEDFKDRKEFAVSRILDPNVHDTQGILDQKSKISVYEYIIDLERNMKAAREVEEEASNE